MTRTLRALLAGMMLALLVAASVSAYAGEVAATVQVSGPAGQQACGTQLTITATIEDAQGKPISGQPVAWTFLKGKLSGDKIVDASTTTNSKGVATTRIQLACTAHSVTIAATADEAQGTVVVKTSGQGLPRTDTVSAAIGEGDGSSPAPAMLLAALAVLAGAAIVLRRVAVERR